MSLSNPVKSRFWDKVWFWILLLIGFGIVLFLIFFPSNGHKPKLIEKAKAGAKKIKNKAKENLERINREVEQDKAELKEIEQIEDEEERLKALADFANKR